MRRIKVVLEEGVGNVLVKVVLLLRAERLGQELEDGDKGEIEDGLDGHRVEHVDDLAEDPAGEDEGRAEHALHR